ncbi:hypothetical protein P692DRAFT_20693349, partial [Suillus brevipes Sb2]
CKRSLTVHELAQSQGFSNKFVFHAENDCVAMIHRQIDDAVPWPVAMTIGRELKQVL